MMVYDEDVEQCLYYLEQGEDFIFVVDGNKNTLKKELEFFSDDIKMLSDKYISSKFTFLWR
jgi:hypothetical protein